MNMKIKIIILLVLISFNSFSQEKEIEIWQRAGGNEVLQAVYNPDSTINIQMIVRDEASDNSTKEITVFSGSPKDYYTFIDELISFTAENKPEGDLRISGTIGGTSVYLEKFLGSVQLWITENGGSSYHHLSPGLLSKFQDKFTEWANKNKIPYQ